MRNRLSIITVTVAALAAVSVAALDAPSAVRAQSAVHKTASRERTLTLTIANMTCALCPVTVRKAIAHVPGVRSVDIDFAAKTATVLFDPSIASAREIAAASTRAGYPAKTAG